MLCLVYVVVYHALFAGGLVYVHVDAHGAFSPLQAALAVFCAINAWICVCELALLVHSAKIQRVHRDTEAKLGVGRMPPVFLFEHASLRQVFSLEYWSVMWSTYAALDPSYADTTTFGFCVDVGNGVTTLLPTLAFAIGMTWPILEPRWLGMLGLVSFYQEMCTRGPPCPPTSALSSRSVPPPRPRDRHAVASSRCASRGRRRHMRLLLSVRVQPSVCSLAAVARARHRGSRQRAVDRLPAARHVGERHADTRRHLRRVPLRRGSRPARTRCLTKRDAASCEGFQPTGVGRGTPWARGAPCPRFDVCCSPCASRHEWAPLSTPGSGCIPCFHPKGSDPQIQIRQIPQQRRPPPWRSMGDERAWFTQGSTDEIIANNLRCDRPRVAAGLSRYPDSCLLTANPLPPVCSQRWRRGAHQPALHEPSSPAGGALPGVEIRSERQRKKLLGPRGPRRARPRRALLARGHSNIRDASHIRGTADAVD